MTWCYSPSLFLFLPAFLSFFNKQLQSTYVSQALCLDFWLFNCDKKKTPHITWNLPSQSYLSVKSSTVHCIHNGVQPASRTLFLWWNWTLGMKLSPLNTKSLFPSAPSRTTTMLLSVSMNLTTPGSSYEWTQSSCIFVTRLFHWA